MENSPEPKTQVTPEARGLSHLVSELSQRNVFKVGAVYGISGWLIIQLANNIFPAFDFPQWTYQFVIIITLIGFPIALIFAWAFEITPEGLKKSSEVARQESIAPQTGRKLNTLIISSMAVLLVFMLIERIYFMDSSPTEQTATVEVNVEAVLPAISVENGSTTNPTISEKSIAVLPFDDFDAGGEEAYFADGLTEEILNALARTPDLLVASRTSSFEYKDQALDIKLVADALGVAHILEGSVRRSPTRLRVTAQLIRASDGFHLWSENYDRQPDDIIVVQEDIAFQIAAALQTVMDPQALRAMVQSGTRSVPAYNAYLKGMSASGKQRYDFFEQARQLDPEFAAAHDSAASYWRNQLNPLIIRREGSAENLDPEQMLVMYQERISRAIETAAVPAQYLYRADQAQVNLQLRASLGFLQQYLQTQATENITDSLQQDAMLLAVSLGEKEFALQLLDTLRSSASLDAQRYNRIIQGYRQIAEYEAGYQFTLEAISKFPNDEDLLYQANQLLYWGGYIEDAKKTAERITGSRLPLVNVLLMRVRHACADGDSAEANRLYEEELKGLNSPFVNFFALSFLGRPDEANDTLRDMDQESSLFSLSGYLQYPFFDPRVFPNLQRVLERELVSRPPVDPIPYACQ